MTLQEQSLTAEFSAPSLEAWVRLVEKALKGVDFEKRLVQRTLDGLRVEPLYTRETFSARAQAAASERAAGRITTYQSGDAPWQMSQLCIESDPAAANAVLIEEMAAGATGIALRMDAPGQAGLPPTKDALAKTLAGIELARIAVAFQAAESTPGAIAALEAVWAQQKTPARDRKASFNLDPVGDMARLGGLGEPLANAVADAARLAADPRWSDGTITVLVADGRPYHEAGGSEAQELACCLATLVSYLRALETEALPPPKALPRISIGLAADADLFLTMAKLRAARRLIARVAEAAGTATGARLPIAVTTSERMMARRDPWVNLLRTCAAGMAGALGGADALTILPFTWALGRPDPFARRIARNMHVVLCQESGLGRTADPAGGSWYLESLTDDLAHKAWSEFQAIEAAGGIEAALRSGFIKDRISKIAGDRTKALTTGRAALTGVSAFPKLGSDGVAVVPHQTPTRPIGTADRVPRLAPSRLAEPFETLRDRAEAAGKQSGRAARIFLASLGTAAEHSARSTWIANFLAAGGIEAIAGDGFTSSAEAGHAFAESGAAIACICSSDQVYAELAEATAGILKQAGAKKVLLAGRPRNEDELRAAGVDAFLFAGQDAIATLTALHGDFGIA